MRRPVALGRLNEDTCRSHHQFSDLHGGMRDVTTGLEVTCMDASPSPHAFQTSSAQPLGAFASSGWLWLARIAADSSKKKNATADVSVGLPFCFAETG
jgi:hypothetical protein